MDPILLTGLISLALGSYLYGSICWAIIIARIKLHTDIRQLGDKNPGAFNVGKTLGGKLGVLVMLLDSTKGLIPAIFASTIDFDIYQNWAIALGGICSILGHCYPIFFSFKGGNGISTLFGFMIIYHPWMVLEWGIFVFTFTLLFKYIRPIQLISTVLTGTTGLFITWPFYWQNFFPLLVPELVMGIVPITVLLVSLAQAPRFVPYFFGIAKGTEEKTYFLPMRSSNKAVLKEE